MNEYDLLKRFCLYLAVIIASVTADCYRLQRQINALTEELTLTARVAGITARDFRHLMPVQLYTPVCAYCHYDKEER